MPGERAVTAPGLASLPRAERLVGELPLSRRGAAILGIGAGASLLTAFLLLVFRSAAMDEVSVQADSYSQSALGHSALLALLRDLGRPVLQSRHESDHRAGKDSLLVLAEPHTDGDLDRRLAAMVATAARVLVVLPKRDGAADPEQPAWLDSAQLLPVGRPAEVLSACGIDAEIVRAADDALVAAVPLPVPTIAAPQLLRADGVDRADRLVTGARGILLGALPAGGKKVFVLADPDPIANHGIDDGDNAAFAVALLDRLRAGRPIVLDETLHGWELEPSAFAQLGRFPLVLLLAQLLLLTAVVLWMAAGRFGAPVPVPPAIAPGKGFLIQNIAALLGYCGHGGPSLRQFLQHRVRQASSRLHAPAAADQRAAIGWLVQRGGAAGRRLAGLADEVEHSRERVRERAAVRLAQDIDTTLEELVHGRG